MITFCRTDADGGGPRGCHHFETRSLYLYERISSTIAKANEAYQVTFRKNIFRVVSPTTIFCQFRSCEIYRQRAEKVHASDELTILWYTCTQDYAFTPMNVWNMVTLGFSGMVIHRSAVITEAVRLCPKAGAPRK